MRCLLLVVCCLLVFVCCLVCVFVWCLLRFVRCYCVVLSGVRCLLRVDISLLLAVC